jgi:uncharacterized membrane protein
MTDPENPTPPSPPPTAPPPPPTAPPPPAPASQSGNALMIVLAYLGIFAVIPLVVEKDDAEVQWHAKHGLVLLVADLVLFTVLWTVSTILGMVFAPLGCVVSLFTLVVGLGVLAVHIMAMVKGVNGDRLIIPYVSEFANRF